VLSGGTHVMSHFNRDWPRVSQLLDVSAIEDSATVSFMAEEAVLGTAVTYATVLSNTGARLPGLLRQIAGGITGGPQIRNQGTIGGSACYANPASDIPTGLVALDATMRCVSASRGERTLPASAFFRSAFVTALDPDEILVSIALAYDNPSERWGYVKLKTTESSWPVAVAAAKVCGGRVTITIGASTEIPVTIGPFQLQNASRISADDAAVIGDRVRTTAASWWSDELSDATYRKRMAEVVAVRAVQDAFAREHTHE
jgi:aerobic carbon-monoxide dehydrogenase medium subunit